MIDADAFLLSTVEVTVERVTCIRTRIDKHLVGWI